MNSLRVVIKIIPLLIRNLFQLHRLHLGMRAGAYFIIIGNYFMAPLNLIMIFNTMTKYKILWLLFELILNRSLAGYNSLIKIFYTEVQINGPI